jgi:translocation protein SEC63
LIHCTLQPAHNLAEAVATAPRIESSFRPNEADIIDKQRRKQKRAQRRLKRMIAAAVGWAVIAWMAYLMIYTARTVTTIWDPYEVLGIARVGGP